MYCVKLTRKDTETLKETVVYLSPLWFISASERFNALTNETETLVSTPHDAFVVIESAREVNSRINNALGEANVPTF